MFKVGVQTFDISPEIGQPMGGYWRYKKFIEGVRDPVFGNALVLSDDKTTYVLIVLDDLVLDSELVASMRTAISERIGVAPDYITIHVNHTHSTSVTLMQEPTNKDYPFLLSEGIDVEKMKKLTLPRRKKLVELVAAGAEIATLNMKSAKVGFRKGEAKDIGRNRNDPDGPIDTDVTVIRFDFNDDSPSVLLTNFSTHPTIAPPQNTLVSGDLVGSTKETIKKILGHNISVLYTTGAAGDVSTRFTRQGSTFEEVDRMGRMLGGEIINVTSGITEFDEDASLNVINDIAEFKVRKLPDEATAKQQFENAKQELEEAKQAGKSPGYVKKLTENLEGATFQYRIAKLSKAEQMAFNQDMFKAELQAVRIGDIKIIFAPFELYSEIALYVKEQTKGEKVVVIGYSNNWLSYIATDYAYEENAYESYITLGVKGTDKIIKDKFLDMVSRL